MTMECHLPVLTRPIIFVCRYQWVVLSIEYSLLGCCFSRGFPVAVRSVLRVAKDIDLSIVSIDVLTARDLFVRAAMSTERNTMFAGDPHRCVSTYFQKGQSEWPERKIRCRLHFAVELFDGQGIILDEKREYSFRGIATHFLHSCWAAENKFLTAYLSNHHERDEEGNKTAALLLIRYCKSTTQVSMVSDVRLNLPPMPVSTLEHVRRFHSRHPSQSNRVYWENFSV